jgi:hypothetical protein
MLSLRVRVALRVILRGAVDAHSVDFLVSLDPRTFSRLYDAQQFVHRVVPLTAGIFAIEELNASIKFSGPDLKLCVHISIFSLCERLFRALS